MFGRSQQQSPLSNSAQSLANVREYGLSEKYELPGIPTRCRTKWRLSEREWNIGVLSSGVRWLSAPVLSRTSMNVAFQYPTECLLLNVLPTQRHDMVSKKKHCMGSVAILVTRPKIAFVG